MLQRTDGVSDHLGAELLLLMGFPRVPVLATRIVMKKSRAAVRILPLCVVRRGRGGEFLEARIIPKRIEHRIESEQAGREWHVFSQ